MIGPTASKLGMVSAGDDNLQGSDLLAAHADLRVAASRTARMQSLEVHNKRRCGRLHRD